MQRGAPLCAGMRSTLLTTARDSGSNKNRLLGPVSPPPLPSPFIHVLRFLQSGSFSPSSPGFTFPGCGLRGAVETPLRGKVPKPGGRRRGRGRRRGAALAGGVQAHGGQDLKTLRSAPHPAGSSWPRTCPGLMGMKQGQDPLGEPCPMCPIGGTSEGPITPRSTGDPQEGGTGVCWLPVSVPPSPACPQPSGCFPAWPGTVPWGLGLLLQEPHSTAPSSHEGCTAKQGEAPGSPALPFAGEL